MSERTSAQSPKHCATCVCVADVLFTTTREGAGRDAIQHVTFALGNVVSVDHYEQSIKVRLAGGGDVWLYAGDRARFMVAWEAHERAERDAKEPTHIASGHAGASLDVKQAAERIELCLGVGWQGYDPLVMEIVREELGLV